jgi:hypothetical protein
VSEQRRRPTRRPRRLPSSRTQGLAEDWAWELSAVGYLPVKRIEAELALRGQADILVAALLSEPFRPQPAAAVGEYLVGSLEVTGAEALRRTLVLLGDRLLDGLPLSAEAGRYRLIRSLAELAAGWGEALRERILTEQEAVHRAAQTARRDTDPHNPWFG